MIKLTDDIEQINNVGTQRANKLHQLGIYKIYDIIEYFPRDYNDRTNILEIKNLIENEENTFTAIIASTPENINIKNKIMTKVKLKDSTGTITGIWYNQVYLKNTFRIGEEYLFSGKVTKNYNKLEIINPEYEKIDNKELLSGGRIVPIYSSTYKFSQKMIRTIIKNVLDEVYNEIEEFMPDYIQKEYKLIDRVSAIQNIHFPSDNQMFFSSRYRLVFEELFLLQLGLTRIKLVNSNSKKGVVIEKVNEEQDLINSLPFKLTNAQINALDEIKKDLLSGNSMNRLIQGDVGSGKTIVALLASYIVVKNGYQVAMMVPTEVLAQQHYESFNNYLSDLGINIALLTGSITKKQKTAILEDLQSGKINIVLGTHAIIQENVLFNNLGLVITDEQHRFGVAQRAKLSSKGDNPHTLVMTATPIPRTLALILYGDLDITIIDELPPGRQKIDTFSVGTSYYERIYEFIKKEIAQGRQAYIICPMVEESEKLEDLKSVIEYTEKLKEKVFNNYTIEFVHGKLKSKEKQIIMDRFIKGETDILVATTVIEVGINVPNASIMVIENSDRFGLAQLHQLRGRVGRGTYKSYCILVTDSKNKVTLERMKIMQTSNDGFELSQVDLDLRGPGDFFGTRQHGLPEMKIANLYKDVSILKTVQEAVNKLLEYDYMLEREEHLGLRLKVEEFFRKNDEISL